MVSEFHHVYSLPTSFKPIENPLKSSHSLLRYNLIKEEFEELTLAFASNDPVEYLDALADLVYVIYGDALVKGWNLPHALERVHESNMSKLDPETQRPIYREDGKILKGANFKPPYLADLTT